MYVALFEIFHFGFILASFILASKLKGPFIIKEGILEQYFLKSETSFKR